ncbi:MAG: UPF0179 family protein [Candidatus Methanoplasma sp.]|jgi:uncharacterized protein (UPF0179 family)|nr:UPF0179 family protein [Candidatus Methanoplasma sp.]
MVAITLISDSLAETGKRFYFLGPQPECEACKLRGACLNLSQGSMYVIRGVRPQTHECALNEGLVRAVEIEKAPTAVVIPKRSAIEGSLITLRPYDCGQMRCANYSGCHPVCMEGGKYSVLEVAGDVECLAGEKVVSAKIL